TFRNRSELIAVVSDMLANEAVELRKPFFRRRGSQLFRVPLFHDARGNPADFDRQRISWHSHTNSNPSNFPSIQSIELPFDQLPRLCNVALWIILRRCACVRIHQQVAQARVATCSIVVELSRLTSTSISMPFPTLTNTNPQIE